MTRPTLKPSAVVPERREAAELIRGIESLVDKLNRMPSMSLKDVERYERALVKGHRGNLIRISLISEAALLAVEEEAA